MAITIHPSAVVEEGARLGEGCVVGPFAYVGPEVTLGEGTQVGPHCVLHGKVTLGKGNLLVSHCAVGGPPQDVSYKGEASEVIVGDGNVFREFVTLNRATNAVYVSVEARASGEFRVSVAFDAPTGRLPLAAGTIIVRSTATSVVGIVLSLGAVAVLLGWWLRTARRSRNGNGGPDGAPAP